MIKALMFLVTFASRLVPFFKVLPGYFRYVWRFFRWVAASPISILVFALLPIIDLFAETFFGVSLGVGTVFRNLVSKFFLSIVTIAVPDLEGLYNSLPSTVIEICCYLGVSEALELIFTGIASAMAVILSLKITMFLFWLKFKIFGIGMRKM